MNCTTCSRCPLSIVPLPLKYSSSPSMSARKFPSDAVMAFRHAHLHSRAMLPRSALRTTSLQDAQVFARSSVLRQGTRMRFRGCTRSPRIFLDLQYEATFISVVLLAERKKRNAFRFSKHMISVLLSRGASLNKQINLVY